MHVPTLSEIAELRSEVAPYIVETPVWRWDSGDAVRIFGDETQVFLKLELFQRTGTFKPRGALSVMLDLEEEALAKGVTAVSAGNHAIAVAYAAGILGTSAKVVMPRSASPIRVARSEQAGAEVVGVADDEAARLRGESLGSGGSGRAGALQGPAAASAEASP